MLRRTGVVFMGVGGVALIALSLFGIDRAPDTPGGGETAMSLSDPAETTEERSAAAGNPSGNDDAVAALDPDAGVIAEAIAAARASLPAALNIMIAPPADVTDFALRVAVAHDGGTEHLWMRDCSMGFEEFRCTAANDATATAIRSGDPFTFNAETITDWMYEAKGRIHGGYTIRAMLPSLPSAQAEAIAAQLAPLP
ncbi:MAG: DUF2314 domain-containing protein [Pseudomonadota bacterium]